MKDFSAPALAWRGEFTETLVYEPQRRPGFVAWASAFAYGDGSIGLSFDEILEQENPDFTPMRLEYAEAAGVPVSYGSVEAGSASQRTYRVYLRAPDGVHFTETGRCPRARGALCNVGFPDGRIVGFDVPRRNEAGTGWCTGISVRESEDGGATWRDVRTLLPDQSVYMWRARRLRGGTIILLASLYGTPWGANSARPARNALLPGETELTRVQAFFLTTEDGVRFSEPHFILPGIGAHEYDVAELPDGRLLFVAGDVQATPVGRQLVTPTADGWVNGPLLPVRGGAPQNAVRDPQGGFVPETLAWDDARRCLVGYRRGKGFSLSNDGGENWTRTEPDVPYTRLYQPMLLPLGGGRFALYGHVGGDNAFGECEMSIRAQVFSPDGAAGLPGPTRLSIERLLLPDASGYRNAFRVRLTADGAPLAGQEVEFRFTPFWNADGSVNTTPQESAPYTVRAVTNADGAAEGCAPWFDGRADIHLAYRADAVFYGTHALRACTGPLMTVLALTPRRREPFPYDAYFAGGVLYLSPGFLADFPQTLEALRAAVGDSPVLPDGILCEEARARLARCGVLETDENGVLRWIASVHAPRPLDDVRVMASGDWYV